MRQSTLKLHMKRHQGGGHAQERFDCDHCNLKFSQQEELDSHTRMHHPEPTNDLLAHHLEIRDGA